MQLSTLIVSTCFMLWNAKQCFVTKQIHSLVTREIDMAYAFVATTILQFNSHHNTASMSNSYFHANYWRFEFCDSHIITFSKPLLISKGIRALAYPTTHLPSWPLAMIFCPQRLIHSKSQKGIRYWDRKIRAIYFDVGGKVISTTRRNYDWQIFVQNANSASLNTQIILQGSLVI